MDEWLTCQGKWLYLEPIFSAEEIMKQIPREGSAFRLMDASWRVIVEQVSLGVQAAAGRVCACVLAQVLVVVVDACVCGL